ncbi:zinc finger protein 569 [Etheostoma spectabile]|uniref:zinc finger protein 569 n=1 Tax=Etheostoma spectabile TaxID=54343 RepID=UPI0013AFD9BA|nr:zinc finger protein 569-like [Etheostoma spectabile]
MRNGSSYRRTQRGDWSGFSSCSKSTGSDLKNRPGLISLFVMNTLLMTALSWLQGLARSILKPSAVPSVCVKSEPDEPEPDQEPEGTIEVVLQCDQLSTCDSPYSYSEESESTSTAAQESPAPSDASDSFEADYGQMLQQIVNIDVIREKAALLHTKGKYVVNEKRLLKLFSHKCPSCGSKVRMEKVTHGVLIILNQQCLQCDYSNQWKSQVNASVPTAEDQQLTEVVEVDLTPETQQTVSTDDNSQTFSDEKRDYTGETEESDDESDRNSDEDWNPAEDLLMANELHDESEDETGEEEEEDDLPFASKYSQLCTECGKFFNKQKPHTCEHKMKPYACNVCGRRFISDTALNLHSKIHDANYELPCKYCHVTFKTKVDKITHQQIHLSEEKPYKCPDCSETFATNKQRRIHREDHGGPPQLKCHICGIEFTRPYILQRHLAVHTGEKPFKCSVCQRGFNQPSHLKSHMRLHTGERPFKCQHCDKSFNHNVSLKSHVQRYHSSNSGHEQKTGKINQTVSDSGHAQENVNMRGADFERDKDVKLQKQSKVMATRKRRSSGRPIGRPKRNVAGNVVPAGEMQGQPLNTKTARDKVRKLQRTRCSDEESEDEPTESDVSFHSTEEEEEESSEKVTMRVSKPRGKAKHSDGDSDFEPQERKKKRYSRQTSGKSSGKGRGNPRKNQVVKDM